MKLKNTGFTLIELLVVIAILGILMALIVPKFSKIISGAKEHKCRNNLRQLQVAVMNYVNDKDGNLPFAMSYEVLEPTSGTYQERRGWISWTKREWKWGDTRDVDKLNNLWNRQNNTTPHENELADDLGTGQHAKFGIENGTLFPYLGGSFEPYVCPIMRSEKESRSATIKTEIVRTYAMNTFFGSPECRLWDPRKATRIGTAETYKYPGDEPNTHIPEGAKLLLFCEVVPSVANDDLHERNNSSDPLNRGDCCISPRNKTLTSPDNNDLIAYDKSQNTFGIHSSPIKDTKASLAVFFDGHIEKVFSKIKSGTENAEINSAWYYVRGLDPAL